jgi:hypothetical protein
LVDKLRFNELFEKLVYLCEELPPSASHSPPSRKEAYVRFTFESSHIVKLLDFARLYGYKRGIVLPSLLQQREVDLPQAKTEGV